MKYLNKNREIVRKKEMKALWNTVLVSIFITIAFGIIDNRTFFKDLFNSILSSNF